MKTLQLPKYKTTHAHAPESTVDVVVFLFYVLNFRFYRTPKQTILAEGFEGKSISGSLARSLSIKATFLKMQFYLT